jgi:hypothetical protein
MMHPRHAPLFSAWARRSDGCRLVGVPQPFSVDHPGDQQKRGVIFCLSCVRGREGEGDGARKRKTIDFVLVSVPVLYLCCDGCFSSDDASARRQG